MSKTQFWILNLVGVACATLVVMATVLGRQNDRVVRQLEANQARLTRAQQVQVAGRNLLKRLNQAAETEPALRQLLTRHEISIRTDESNATSTQ